MNEHKEQMIKAEGSQSIMNSFQAVETTLNGAPVLGKNDELLEMGASFDFDGFQVVRREFFAHLNEPSISFNNYKFYVNTACLTKFPDTEYVQACPAPEFRSTFKVSFACFIVRKFLSPDYILPRFNMSIKDALDVHLNS
jgi:hypothetical protein